MDSMSDRLLVSVVGTVWGGSAMTPCVDDCRTSSPDSKLHGGVPREAAGSPAVITLVLGF